MVKEVSFSVPVNHEERRYLEYRPNLGLRVNLRGLLESVGRSPDEVYEVPDEILEATQALGSDVLAGAKETRNRLGKLIDDVMAKLSGVVANGISLADYIEGRKSKDAEVTAAWEDHHALSLDGKLEGELLAILLDAQEELDETIRFLADTLFDGNDDVASCREQEIRELERIIQQDMKEPDEEALAELKMRNELIDALSSEVAAVQGLVEKAEALLAETLEDWYSGGLDMVVEQFANAPNLDSLAEFSGIQFHTLAPDTPALIEQMRTFSGLAMLQELHEDAKLFCDLKRKAWETVRWLDTLHDVETPALRSMVDHQLSAIDQVLDGYDETFVELHRRSELKNLQQEEVFAKLREKEKARKTYHLLKRMKSEFDFRHPNRRHQIERFVRIIKQTG